MPRIIQKYGGTSLASIERISYIARRIKAEVDAGHEIAVVVSAMGKTTDLLYDWVCEIFPGNNGIEQDVVLSTGEQVTSGLLALSLQRLGVAARSWLAWQLPIMTDKVYTKACIEEIEVQHLLAAMRMGEVAIVAGYQGITEDRRITTLGRGGSDTTAIHLARALQADQCDIFTDVEGIYTADPRYVVAAKKLHTVPFKEMLEGASAGIKALETKCVELAYRYNMPIRLLSSFTEAPGTVIGGDESMPEENHVTLIGYDESEAFVTINEIASQAESYRLLEVLAAYHIKLDMINWCFLKQGMLCFLLPRSDIARFKNIMSDPHHNFQYNHVDIQEDVAKISLMGIGMRSQPSVLGTIYFSVAKVDAKILQMMTSELKISLVTYKKEGKVLLNTLHDAFHLSTQEIKVA